MIVVLAGVNGAGKSSVIGSHIRNSGGNYFNPDEYTRHLIGKGEAENFDEANVLAWRKGFEGLKNAIQNKAHYTFETTLGGRSITTALKQAVVKGIAVRIVYVGLSSVDQHIERVKARVKNGGHDIPSDKIRDRYSNSKLNLIELINHGVDEVVVWDNSSKPEDGKPSPSKVFHFNKQGWVEPPDGNCPEWAKSIAAEAIKKLLKEN
jgi:predicted ABC-type ATPase